MEAVSLFQKKFHVNPSNVDFKKSMKLSHLFNGFQDIASLASENQGFGITDLEHGFGVSWILIKIRVDIIRYPRMEEEITIETWAQTPGKLEFERDFIVRDQQGNIIVRAVSAWVIMDMKERKLKRTDVISYHTPKAITERAIDCKLGKLKRYGELELAYKRVIGYSDIDFNGHLNNSEYVDFIMDCFPLEDHIQRGIKSIEVNFKNEVLPGNTIILYKDTTASNENKFYIEGVNEKDKVVMFKSEVKIG
ncbi:acyl-[acyl-carrier-protein] thioesterase [Oceanobacillus chungangensis]|uniref:Acyl-ACP thioesterase n=1 Tax=Oceanobacillus chungangensis TaxID=1229152 RepID=A0A3D8PJE5_9BACI|nr:acyl-ACP thioesterase domain-containing protein [Oceanobacillus chungangensis]RDW15607.1 acyl-ACP thioesterase [Oceanobacillus chungangensis]